jgi:predicted small secreted protein
MSTRAVTRLVAVLAVSLLLAACQSNRVQTLGPNMLRLDMTGLPVGSEEQILQQLLALGARETLLRGYTHFRLIDWKAGAPQVVTQGQPQTANFSVTLVMFHQGEQGNNPVFDARHIAQDKAATL